MSRPNLPTRVARRTASGTARESEREQRERRGCCRADSQSSLVAFTIALFQPTILPPKSTRNTHSGRKSIHALLRRSSKSTATSRFAAPHASLCHTVDSIKAPKERRGARVDLPSSALNDVLGCPAHFFSVWRSMRNQAITASDRRMMLRMPHSRFPSTTISLISSFMQCTTGSHRPCPDVRHSAIRSICSSEGTRPVEYTLPSETTAQPTTPLIRLMSASVHVSTMRPRSKLPLLTLDTSVSMLWDCFSCMISRSVSMSCVRRSFMASTTETQFFLAWYDRKRGVWIMWHAMMPHSLPCTIMDMVSVPRTPQFVRYSRWHGWMPRSVESVRGTASGGPLSALETIMSDCFWDESTMSLILFRTRRLRVLCGVSDAGKWMCR
mmetsp:Transcript_21998/g.54211  ORF Transcript_21998/g.54211 Transcript_21998/m.54211 type:complete len:382 (-) Transcript_21998:795-1940(-)